MLANFKRNIALALEGLFGERYGFFDLMVDAGKFPGEGADILRLTPPAVRRAEAPAAPAAGVREAA